MSPVSTSCSDFDSLRLCFLPEEEDFYPPPRSQLLPGPGEDIWKKFELLPTPSPPDGALSAADHLEAVSDLLDDSSASFLHSFIIQDCMWSSSFAAATKLEEVVSERLASLRARRHAGQESAAYLQDLHAAASDCIDPSALLPAANTPPELSPDSPPFSSSQSEREEEDEEGDEEIDVVTVDKLRTSRRSDSSPLVLRRSNISIHQHNYAAQRPAGKRSKETARQRGGRRCRSPPSDGEDGVKRRTHNVLERQRRDELRRSFRGLRQEVPAVASSEKAAKVAILTEAAAFIRGTRAEERRLLAEKEELRRRGGALRRRLERLHPLP